MDVPVEVGPLLSYVPGIVGCQYHSTWSMRDGTSRLDCWGYIIRVVMLRGGAPSPPVPLAAATTAAGTECPHATASPRSDG